MNLTVSIKTSSVSWVIKVVASSGALLQPNGKWWLQIRQGQVPQNVQGEISLRSYGWLLINTSGAIQPEKGTWPSVGSYAVADIIELIDERIAMAVVRAKRGGCSCHTSPPCAFCENTLQPDDEFRDELANILTETIERLRPDD